MAPAPSTLALLWDDPARAPNDHILDTKLVEKEILLIVLNSWLGNLEEVEYRSWDEHYQQYAKECKLVDRSAIAFTLMDARFMTTLYCFYHVQSELELWRIQHAWKRRLAASVNRDASVPVPASAHPSPSPSPVGLRRLFIPQFRAVKCDDPGLYANISPELLACIINPRFCMRGDYTSTPPPRGTTIFDFSGHLMLSSIALPTTLQRLTLGHAFNEPIEMNVLPASLRTLTFRDDSTFNQRIGMNVLPASLQQLTFGGAFNQPIDRNVLPASLRALTFGKCSTFNQPIGMNVLPASLQMLTFGNQPKFNQPIGMNVLPASLQQLMFDGAFNQPICLNVLPASLQRISLSSSCPSLDVTVLPASLQQLTLGCAVNDPFGTSVLPSSLWQLTIAEFFNQPIGPNFLLPTNLEELTFTGWFDQPIRPNELPASLLRLKFAGRFNRRIDPNVLPASLQQLTFSGSFYQPIRAHVLPPSLETLSFERSSFNHPIGEDVLPASLKQLIFGDRCSFNKRLRRSCIPSGCIVIGRDIE